MAHRLPAPPLRLSRTVPLARSRPPDERKASQRSPMASASSSNRRYPSGRSPARSPAPVCLQRLQRQHRPASPPVAVRERMDALRSGYATARWPPAGRPGRFSDLPVALFGPLAHGLGNLVGCRRLPRRADGRHCWTVCTHRDRAEGDPSTASAVAAPADRSAVRRRRGPEQCERPHPMVGQLIELPHRQSASWQQFVDQQVTVSEIVNVLPSIAAEWWANRTRTSLGIGGGQPPGGAYRRQERIAIQRHPGRRIDREAPHALRGSCRRTGSPDGSRPHRPEL